MTTFIALLRGVNVGGANLIGTKELVAILESLGLKNVKTYIASGNAVFQAKASETARLPGRITTGIQRSHGFAPQVMLLPLDDFESAIKSNPYPGGHATPKALHLAFMASPPSAPDLTMLENVRGPSEQYSLDGRVFYFWTPEGVGRSKLFSRLERALGTPCTARNWRTVCKLLEIGQDIQSGNGSSTAEPGTKKTKGRK